MCQCNEVNAQSHACTNTNYYIVYSLTNSIGGMWSIFFQNLSIYETRGGFVSQWWPCFESIWSVATHICVSKLTSNSVINASVNGLTGISLLTEQSQTYCRLYRCQQISGKFVSINNNFVFTKTCVKMSSAKCRPFCSGFNRLIPLIRGGEWISFTGKFGFVLNWGAVAASRS